MTVVAPPEEAEADAPPRGAEESPAAFVRRLALAKATAVAPRIEAGLLLACDTVAELDGRLLGKPADRAEARRMLESLSGREHRVVSGVCLWRLPDGPPQLADATSVLTMESLTDEFLEWYLDAGLWRGKAGACGFQDERLPLRLIAGSASNVVGLPVELVRAMLGDPRD